MGLVRWLSKLRGGARSVGPTWREQRTGSCQSPSAFHVLAMMPCASPSKSSNLKIVIKNSAAWDDEWL